MSLVTYDVDGTGMGMLSKAGKFTSEKYAVFRKKDEILWGKPKYLKVSHFPQFDMAWGDESECDESNGEITARAKINLKSDVTRPQLTMANSEPMAKQMPRSAHFRFKALEALKTLGPQPGMYQPKQVQKNVKVLPNYHQEVLLNPNTDRCGWINSKHNEELKNLDIELSSGPLRPRVSGPSLHRQTMRHDPRSTTGTRFPNMNGYNTRPDHNAWENPWEDGIEEPSRRDEIDTKNCSQQFSSRVAPLNLQSEAPESEADFGPGHASSSCQNRNRSKASWMRSGDGGSQGLGTTYGGSEAMMGNTSRVSGRGSRVCDFNKYKDRPPLFSIKTSTKIDTNYHPNYNINKPRDGNLCMEFQKGTGRTYTTKHKNSKSTGNLRTVINPNSYKVFNNGRSLSTFMSFKKTLGRNQKPDGLPLWMQKKNGSRFALNCNHEKALE